jgi:hypothetical protein
MHWVRKTRRFGSWLALFALALQLVLSFGHIHAEDFAPTSIQTAADSGHHAGTPADPDHDGDHHDCPICATMAMLASLVVPLPPVVPLPAHETFIVAAETEKQPIFGPPPRQFQARAPPLVS